MDVCFVYHKPVRREKSEFATLPVKRSANYMSDTVDYHVLYSGHLNESSLTSVGVKCHWYDFGGSRLRNLRRAVADIERTHGIDVFSNVWVHYEGLLLQSAIDEASVGLRVVGNPLSGYSKNPGKRLLKLVGKSVERLSLNRADFVYANSYTLRDKLVPKHRSNVEVISQGVDTKRFAYADSAKSDELLYVGRLNKNKGLTHTVEAFDQLDSGASLTIIGPGDLPEDVRNRVEANPNISFQGFIPHEETPGLFQRAAGLVLPSKSEGLPNVVIEAQACGTPVIVSNVGDCKRFVDAGGGLLIKDREDRANVADAMRVLVTDEERSREMGIKGRTYVENNHSLEIVSERLEHLFKSTAEV